ncbi:MAG: radical SAM protein [Chitinispirillaceae bacterium]|nr:radical SAM protein [Chitinispirillaceae bacterium]
MLPGNLPPPRLVAWELTRSCVLRCRHCRASAQTAPVACELTFDECAAVLDSLAAIHTGIVILTGGEPLLRDDLFRLARYGTDKGLRMVMATCGTLLDAKRCAALRDAGIQRISVSIDGATAQSHDAFRGVPGAFDGLMRGIAAAKTAGLAFQVNTTVTKNNRGELPAIFALAQQLGAVSFHPFLLVPTGRGVDLKNEIISAQAYEETLNWIYDLQATSSLSIKPTCAPHYYRIAHQRRHDAAASLDSAARHELDTATGGCLGGKSFAFISHTGIVQICGFLDLPAGDLRAAGYDFGAIWRDSPLFDRIRSLKYGGKCGVCEYVVRCGGCRARAFAESGDYMGEEPQCRYVPRTRRKVLLHA